MRYFGILFLTLTFFACRQNAETEPVLQVIDEKTVLRETPGPRGKTLQTLSPGERVRDLGQVSDFFTPLQFNNAALESPWLHVRTDAGLKGWLLAHDVQPEDGDYTQWQLDKNMEALLRPALAEQYRNWRNETQTIAGRPDILPWFRKLEALRSGLSQRLQQRPERNDAGYQPLFYWLQELLPGISLQWNRPGASPEPFVDYRYCLALAAQTSGQQDDAFLSFCAGVFPPDSIESALPVWVMPRSATESYSQLGSGVHSRLLSEIDSTLVRAPDYRPELLAWKDRILRDILDKDRLYWQSADKICSELDNLLQAPPACLQDHDLLSLRERRAMFGDPGANGIKVNLRSGEE